MSDLIERISNYTYVLRPFNLQRAKNFYQNQTSQLKIKIAQDVVKRDILWYGKNWVITQNLNTYLYKYKISQQKQLFLQLQSTKKQYDSCSYSYNYFPYFKTFARNEKNQIGTMIYFRTQNSNSKINSKLLKYLSKFLVQ